MDKRYLGDSYDIVKRFWAERLQVIAPLLAHPRFVPLPIRSEFENMVGMRVLDPGNPPSHPFGLFLDPHTGVPLPTKGTHKATSSHAHSRSVTLAAIAWLTRSLRRILMKL